MNRTLAVNFLRILLSFALAIEPAFLHAADSAPNTPQTQTGDGGGGNKPPNIPEILFAGPGGDANSNGKKKPAAETPMTGRFADRWGIDKDGRDIYYEGSVNAENYIRVWQYDVANNQYVRRGLVIPAPGTDGKVEWKTFDSFANLYKERAGFVGVNRGNQDGKAGEVYGTDVNGREITYEGWRDVFGNLRVRQWSAANKYMYRRGSVVEIPGRTKVEKSGMYTVKWERGYIRANAFEATESISGNLLEPIKVKTGRVDSAGRPILETVYFEGRRNAEGYELVFRPDTSAGVVNPDTIREGILNSDNSVTWNAQPKSRISLVHELQNLNLDNSKLTPAQKAKFQENIKLLAQVSALPTPAAQSLIYPNSNYPTGGSANTPIPRDHSLVPIEPSKDSEFRSGQSEGNSHFKDTDGYKGPRVETTQYDPADRPSLLGEKLDWTRGKSEKLGRLLQDWAADRVDLIKAKAAAGPKNAEERVEKFRNSPTASFSSGAFTFYAALGVAAAYTLMTDYSNNPNAWSSYLSSLQDPVGWAALSGFVIAGAPFYKMMGGAGYQGKFMRQLPLFAGGLLAGSLVATAISKFGRDEDVRACLGFVAFPLTGKFVRDMPACDRAYNHWLTDAELVERLADIGNDFLPAAASIVVAGGIYLGVLEASKFLINRSAMITAMRSIPIMKSPRGGLISLAIGVGQISFFLGAYYIASSTFNIEKSVKDYLITDFNLNSNMMLIPLWFLPGSQFFVMDRVTTLIQQTGPVPAKTLNEAETQLYNEWSRIKQSNWKNPNLWKNVCYDSHRKYQLFYNCDAPDALDFEGTLDRYALYSKQWRANQLSDTIESYKEWMKKVNDYQSQIDVAHKYYKDVVERVEKQTLTADGLGLSNYAAPSGSGPIWSKDYSGVWKYVDTPKQQDFLFTSIACGPEVEGYGGSDSVWDKTSSFVKHWVTFNYSPGAIIKNPNGSEIQFFPPRLTNPIAGSKSTVCDNAYFGLPTPLDLISHVRFSPLNILVSNDSKNYHGLVDYVRENLRLSVRENGFENWWSQYVAKETNKIEPILRADYKKMLDTTFNRALTNHDYVSGWCGQSTNKTTGLEKYLRKLSTGRETCPSEAMHRLAYGVLDNLRDEMRLYLALLTDLCLANATTTLGEQIPAGHGGSALATRLSDYDFAINSRTKALLEQFDLLLNQLPISDPAQRNVEDAFKKGNAAWSELTRLVIAGPGMEKVDPYQKRWALKLLDKSKDLFANYLTYYKILTTFEPADP